MFITPQTSGVIHGRYRYILLEIEKRGTPPPSNQHTIEGFLPESVWNFYSGHVYTTTIAMENDDF